MKALAIVLLTACGVSAPRDPHTFTICNAYAAQPDGVVCEMACSNAQSGRVPKGDGASCHSPDGVHGYFCATTLTWEGLEGCCSYDAGENAVLFHQCD